MINRNQKRLAVFPVEEFYRFFVPDFRQYEATFVYINGFNAGPVAHFMNPDPNPERSKLTLLTKKKIWEIAADMNLVMEPSEDQINEIKGMIEQSIMAAHKRGVLQSNASLHVDFKRK